MKSRKEIKIEYKEQKFEIGVFEIRNKINNRFYIDSGNNIPAKFNRHKFQLNAGLHPNKELQTGWNKYGEINFEFIVIEEIEQKDEIKDYSKKLKELEKKYLTKSESTKFNIYNQLRIKN
jgi:hypothetical protein